jgi:hypothetical protein
MTYPENWPRCPNCGDFALDGHITCGRVECDEGDARRRKAEEWADLIEQGPLIITVLPESRR